MGRTLAHLGAAQRDQSNIPKPATSSKITGKPKPKVEKATRGEGTTRSAQQSTKVVPVELQQLVLNIFKDSFPAYFDSKLPALVQQVKHHLYKRDFNGAFGQDDFRTVYAVRWSPTRALAYTHILANLPPLTTELFPSLQGGPDSGDEESSRRAPHYNRVVCIGAGAGAEVVALGGYLKYLTSITKSNHEAQRDELVSQQPLQMTLSITAIDIADWNEITQTLHSSLTAVPSISQYASSEAKATNAPMTYSGTLHVNLVKQDILNMAVEEMGVIFTNTSLVTLMFTLNELYATSTSATTNLLLSLTMLLEPGALLLVVDSPGSYSTVNMGKPSSAKDGTNSEKKYPMQWLLDHTLLEASAVGSSKIASGERQWEKLESRDSEWFRLDGELRYPIDLEDMRYQLHLYRRL
jgi:25S rRNA (uracil2843-N3)-methyltransferase